MKKASYISSASAATELEVALRKNRSTATEETIAEETIQKFFIK